MKKILLGIILLFTSAFGGAQEETDGKDNGIQLRGFAFEHFEGIDRLELRHEEKKVGELFLPTGQLRNRTPISTRVFSYGVTEAEQFRSLGRVELPEVGRDFILVVVAGKDGYEIYPVRADDPDFRGNDSLVFNLTKYRLEIHLGDAQTHLEPWENSILRPHHAEDATFYQARFSYEKDDAFVPFNNTRWPVNHNVKSMVFVYHDEKTGNPVFRSVTDAVGY